MANKQIIEYVKAKYDYIPQSCWIADVKEQMGFNVPCAHNRKDKNTRKCPCPKDKIEDIKEAIMQDVKSKTQSSAVSETSGEHRKLCHGGTNLAETVPWFGKRNGSGKRS